MNIFCNSCLNISCSLKSHIHLLSVCNVKNNPDKFLSRILSILVRLVCSPFLVWDKIHIHKIRIRSRWEFCIGRCRSVGHLIWMEGSIIGMCGITFHICIPTNYFFCIVTKSKSNLVHTLNILHRCCKLHNAWFPTCICDLSCRNLKHRFRIESLIV